MVQIINDPNRRNAADSFSSGLTNLIQGLAHNKAQQLHQAKERKDLQGAFPELPDSALNFLSAQPPKERLQYLQNYASGLQELQTQDQSTQTQAPTMASQSERVSVDNLTTNQKQQLQKAISNPKVRAAQNPEVLKRIENLLSKQEIESSTPKATSPSIPSLRSVEPKVESISKPVKSPVVEKPKSAIKEKISLLKSLGVKPSKEDRAFEHKEKVLAQKEQMISDKETLPVYKEITKEAKAAEGNDKRLNRMEKLIDEGKLNSRLYAGLVNAVSEGIHLPLIGKLALDVKGLLTPESQEFQKLSTDFLKTAKDVFGSRITEKEVGLFLQTVPTLSQSDEGKRRVIFNLKSFNEAAKIRKNAMEEVIKENGGKRPFNLEERIEEKAGKDLDALSERFTEGYQGPKDGNMLYQLVKSGLPGLDYLGL